MKNTIIITSIIIIILVAGVFGFTALNNKPVNNTGTTSPTTATSSSEKCIITIMDKKYDVTQWKNTHPGGNIFVCGSDMTNQYTAQHGRNTQKLSQYLGEPISE